MAACISSSLGLDQYSSNKFDELLKLPRYKRYFDFSSHEINDSNKKRLNFSHDVDQDVSFSIGKSSYSFKNVDDELFKLPRYKRYFDFSSHEINDSNKKRLNFSHDVDQDVSFSIGKSSYSFKNVDDELFKLPRYKRYFDFSSYEINNDQLENHSNKRLKFSHDDHQDFSFSIDTSLGHIDQYSFKKVDHDEFFNINKRLECSTNKLPCLKMVAGSLYLPKDNPKKPLGEDAHFIHELRQTIGVADWRWWLGEKGDSLMKNSLIAMDDEPKGHVNPKRVLQEAYKNTDYEGSSTACIITLNSKNNTLCAANVGDSGFFLIRKGKIIYKSSIQQRGLFGCPYQLGKCKDDPSVAQEMELNVEKDDILIVGTDGMLDNMNKSEIEKIVQRAIDEKLKAEELARKIGNVALYNSFDRFADTPYARASEGRHKGGKIDDITVLVACIQ